MTPAVRGPGMNPLERLDPRRAPDREDRQQQQKQRRKRESAAGEGDREGRRNDEADEERGGASLR